MATTMTLTLLTLAVSVTVLLGQEAPSVTFTITEEEGSGVYIGNVSSLDLGDTEEQKASMRYRILTENVQQYFSLQDTTGKLFTMVVIDRESICLYQDVCKLEFRVAASSGQYYQPVIVTVIVEDINDNDPLFSVSTYRVPVSEGSTINYSFLIKSATDLDTGVNGIQSYEINPASDTFGLTYDKNLDGSFNVQMYLKKALDREQVESYQVTVRALDGGNPQRAGLLIVDIEVTDMNDNKPEFNQSVYNVSVMEDITAESVILTITAKDEDSGDNGLVAYRISERQPNAAEIKTYFSVNSTSGQIRVKKGLIYKADHHYSFIVEAVDHGTSPTSSQAQVLIYVTDVGNNPPKVSVSLLSPGNIGFVNVSEKEKPGFFVAHINVEDSDTGPNGVVECKVSNNLFKVDVVNGGGFKVVVNSVLNREAIEMHNLTVTCFDYGEPSLSSSVSFLVRVTDENDNAPVFDSNSYLANIYENMMEDQQILQVSADDADSGKNKEIHFEIRNQPLLEINPNSGVITAKPFFDREVSPVIIFTVLAIDGGSPPLTSSATVTLTIRDKNDNAPQFLQPSFEFEVEENLNSGTSIGQFSAKDNDIEENGKFTFRIAPDSMSSKFPFIVFGDGKIQTNRELDREERSRYDFYVVVTDQGEVPLSSSVSVVVIVTDVNDNNPNITFPTKNNRTVEVLYPDSPSDLVTQVQAYDLDNGENKTLTYELFSGNELGLFRMERNTGRLFIADRTVMIDQNMRLALQVNVSDRGRVPRYSMEELVIYLTYTNATYTAGTSSSNKYVVISVVVVVVTILFSAGIIGLIFLLRCFDRKKSNEMKNNNDVDAGFNSKPTLFITNLSGESSTDMAGELCNGDLKRKKEVSFSDDHESINNSMIDLQVTAFPDPIKFAPEKVQQSF